MGKHKTNKNKNKTENRIGKYNDLQLNIPIVKQSRGMSHMPAILITILIIGFI